MTQRSASDEQQQPASDPLLERAAAEMSATFEVLGQPVVVTTNSQLVIDAARSLLGPKRENLTSSKPLRLRLLVHDVPESHDWRPDQQAVFRAHESLFYVAASRSSVIAGDRESRTAFGFISSQQASDLEHLRAAMIQAAVLWIAGSRLLTPAHAAAVELDGRAMMLRGDAGAGKTTLAVALALQGARLMADDAVFIDTCGDKLIVRGLPWLLYLTLDSARFFDQLPASSVVTRFNGEQKIAIETEHQSAFGVAESAALGPTIFVRRRGESHNRLSRLPEQEARKALEATSIAVERSKAGGIDIWKAMIEAGVYRYDVVSEPVEAARDLIDLLSRVDR